MEPGTVVTLPGPARHRGVIVWVLESVAGVRVEWTSAPLVIDVRFLVALPEASEYVPSIVATLTARPLQQGPRVHEDP